MNSNENHIDIRNKLLKLPKVNAKQGFENELLRRINLVHPESIPAVIENKKEGFILRRKFRWAIPAISFAVIAVIFIGIYAVFFRSDLKLSDGSNIFITEQKKQQEDKSLKKNDSMPGKEIANDFEIGKQNKSENQAELQKGYDEVNTGTTQTKLDTDIKQENYYRGEPLKTFEKASEPTKINTDGKGYSPNDKNTKVIPSDERDAVKNIQPPPKKEFDYEKKAVSPMLKESKDVNKSNETGKTDIYKNTEKEKTEKKETTKKDVSKETLETLSKEIKEKLNKQPDKKEDKNKDSSRQKDNGNKKKDDNNKQNESKPKENNNKQKENNKNND